MNGQVGGCKIESPGGVWVLMGEFLKQLTKQISVIPG